MKILIFIFLSGMTAAAWSAEMYRWVDEKGVVNYTPYPPPANIKKVEQKRFGTNTVQTSEQSYSTQQAVKNFPVTLYATDCGELCKDGRALLVKRGIPYAEKNPQNPDEIDNFKKLTGGGMEVPLLIVGQLKTIKGFQASEWNSALDAAGYPSAALPGAKPAITPPAPAGGPAASSAPAPKK